MGFEKGMREQKVENREKDKIKKIKKELLSRTLGMAGKGLL